MDIQIYKALPVLASKYLESEEVKPLSHMTGRSILKTRSNIGTMTTPIWEVTKMYTMTAEELTMELSTLHQRMERASKTLNALDAEWAEMQATKAKFEDFFKKANDKFTEYQAQQKEFILSASALLDKALEQKAGDAASIMQQILDLLDYTQTELQRLEQEISKLPTKQ